MCALESAQDSGKAFWELPSSRSRRKRLLCFSNKRAFRSGCPVAINSDGAFKRAQIKSKGVAHAVDGIAGGNARNRFIEINSDAIAAPDVGTGCACHSRHIPGDKILTASISLHCLGAGSARTRQGARPPGPPVAQAPPPTLDIESSGGFYRGQEWGFCHYVPPLFW